MAECTTLVQSRYMQYMKRRMCDFYLIYIDVCGYRKRRSVPAYWATAICLYCNDIAVLVYSRELRLHADYSPLPCSAEDLSGGENPLVCSRPGFAVFLISI